jgi:hypothetical protein
MNDGEDPCHNTLDGNILGSIIDVTLVKGEEWNDSEVNTLINDDSTMLSNHMTIQVM